MDSDQREIHDYLKNWPRQYVAAKEICRRAGGKARFQKDPRWAYPVLTRMIEDGLVETDSLGHYRIKEEAKKEKIKRKKWVSPEIEKILKQSGKSFDLGGQEGEGI